jgi:DNA-binding MarR family transcriptional regulator
VSLPPRHGLDKAMIDAYTSIMRPGRFEPSLEVCRLAAAGCACQGVRSAARAVSRLYEGALAPTGLTPTQFAILVAANLRGSVPLSRLAEALVLDRTSLYRAIRPLERDGHVRVGPGRDRREKELALTASGRRKLAEALPLWQRAQGRLLGVLGDAQWGALAAGLADVVRAVERIEAGSAGPLDARPAPS